LLSVGVAVLLQRFRLARSKAVTLACVGLIGWSALISRHYLLEMNIGNSIVRITAETVAALPDSIRTRSILLLAPGVIGTFNTPAVQPSGTRQLIAHYNRGRVGPLYFGESCADIVVASPTVIDEGWLPVPLPAVAAVVRWTEGRAVAFATVRDACGRRS
jgi:hypothetical protein